MKKKREKTNTISGSGAQATTGGVAAGEDGLAIGGNVLGNVIKAATVINIIGGLGNESVEILERLGKKIELLSNNEQTGSKEILELIRTPVLARLGPKITDNIFAYLQIIGFQFSSLIDKYNNLPNIDVFPFGDFLQDMVDCLSKNDIMANCFKGFGLGHDAISCQDVGVLFGATTNYLSIPLEEVNRLLGESHAKYFPHQFPLSLYQRSAAWAGQGVYIGHFFDKAGQDVVCPIRFEGRQIVAHHWQYNIDHHFFISFASALLADFMFYLHKLNVEKQAIEGFLDILRQFQENKNK